jgi:hypothetical protein
MAKTASSRPATTEAAGGGGIAARDHAGDPSPVVLPLGAGGAILPLAGFIVTYGELRDA